MNLKSNKKSKFWCIPYVMLTLLAFFLGSCDDGKEVSPITGSGGTPFNPAFPIRIDSIYPKAGSAGQRVLIYGENFGNNPSQLEVYIGGQKSSVVNVKSTYMYCLMPSKAYEGDIQVTIKDGEKTYVELSAMGDFYLKTVKNCKYLPRSTTNVPVSEKEILSSTIIERPQELDDMLSLLKGSPYVNKLKVVFHNPNRKLKVSKFFILDSDDFESTLALEMKTSK